MGTARCAVRAPRNSGATWGAGFARLTWFVPPAERGRGRRNATAPTRTSQRDVPTFAMVLVGTARPPSAVLLRRTGCAVRAPRSSGATGSMVRAAHVVRSARCTRAGDIAARCPYLCMVFGRNGALRRPSAAQQRRNLGAGFARLVWFVPPADTRAGASQREAPPDIAARCPYLAMVLVGTARPRLRAALLRRTGGGVRRSRDSFRPLRAGGGVAARRPLPGHRSAMSLPKWRALAIGEINEWPVFGTRREFFPHGILQDVISLFPAAFRVSQPVLEEIALPANAHGPGRPFFPFADDELDRSCRMAERKSRREHDRA